MKRLLMFLCIAVLLFNGAIIAQANLLVNGDFQDGAQIINGSVNATSGPFGAWYGNHSTSSAGAFEHWWVGDYQEAGKADDDYYAKHFVNSSKLYQLIDVDSSAVTIGTTLSFSFEYIYDSGFVGAGSTVYVLGMTGTDSINTFFPASIPGDILWSTVLAEGNNFVNSWTYFPSVDINVGAEYDALAVYFNAGAFGATGVGGLRGIDNVSLEAASVPEPATILLFGTGILGLAGIGRKKFLKK